MSHVLVIHGPNLNLLGSREPNIYGTVSLQEINKTLQNKASKQDIKLTCFQSNAEHCIIEKIHNTISDRVSFIIINPAALTHTSISLRDALLAVSLPFFEVHFSNIYARESFRHHSYLADIAQGLIIGLGPWGYLAALDAIIARFS